MSQPAAPHGTTTSLPPPAANGSAPPAPRSRRRPTRISSMRTGLIAGVAILAVVVIFIIQNGW
jgi:hypothetical protein